MNVEYPVVIIIRIIDVVPGVSVTLQHSLQSSALTSDRPHQCPGPDLSHQRSPPARRQRGGETATTTWDSEHISCSHDKVSKLSQTWRSSCRTVQDWSIQEKLRTESCGCSIFSVSENNLQTTWLSCHVVIWYHWPFDVVNKQNFNNKGSLDL